MAPIPVLAEGDETLSGNYIVALCENEETC